jgi:transcription elongation factor Elf1
MKEYSCPKCNSTDLFIRKSGNNTGLYCGDCGAWIKWIGKKEIPLVERFLNFDFSGRYYTTKGNCPVCNSEGLYKSDFYCNKCGQKLDWGEEGEINEAEKGNTN